MQAVFLAKRHERCNSRQRIALSKRVVRIAKQDGAWCATGAYGFLDYTLIVPNTGRRELVCGAKFDELSLHSGRSLSAFDLKNRTRIRLCVLGFGPEVGRIGLVAWPSEDNAVARVTNSPSEHFAERGDTVCEYEIIRTNSGVRLEKSGSRMSLDKQRYWVVAAYRTC